MTTTKSGMSPVRPGLVLGEELNDLGLSARALAEATELPADRVTAILNADVDIDTTTALRLGRFFGTTTRFWLNLQRSWLLRRAERDS